MLTFKEFEEIEEVVAWNLSFGISIKETLTDLGKIKYLNLFSV
jgi:hypothetical protein